MLTRDQATFLRRVREGARVPAYTLECAGLVCRASWVFVDDAFDDGRAPRHKRLTVRGYAALAEYDAAGEAVADT